jgi:hypothetical protein
MGDQDRYASKRAIHLGTLSRCKRQDGACDSCPDDRTTGTSIAPVVGTVASPCSAGRSPVGGSAGPQGVRAEPGRPATGREWLAEVGWPKPNLAEFHLKLVAAAAERGRGGRQRLGKPKFNAGRARRHRDVELGPREPCPSGGHCCRPRHGGLESARSQHHAGTTLSRRAYRLAHRMCSP